MPRKPRLDAEHALHHVMVRGIEGSRLFRNKKDYQDLVHRFDLAFSKGNTSVYAWALMTNHIHLLLRTGTASLSQVMRSILTGYAVTFNRRYRRGGHLFQNRFKSILVEEDPYFLQLVRYIHLNPLRAGIVKTLEELDAYPWSGHAALLGHRDYPWQDCGYVLNCFGRTIKRARNAYHTFVAQGVNEGKRQDLIGGGLLRSTGYAALRGREAWASDERILGSSQFVERVKGEMSMPLKHERKSIIAVIREVAKKSGLSLAELTSGSRRREVVRARSLVSHTAVREEGISLTEVARSLNVSKQSILRGIEKI